MIHVMPGQVIPYLFINLFIVYSYSRIFAVVFDRTQVNRRLEFLGYAALYLLNSGACVFFRSPLLNLLSTVAPLLAISMLYPGKVRTKLACVVGLYALVMLCDALSYFAIRALGLSESFLLGSATISMMIFVLSLILGQLLARHDHPSLDFLHWLAILLIPVGSAVVTLASCYRSTDSRLMTLTMLVLLFINGLVFYLFDVLEKFYAEAYERQFLAQQNRAYQAEFALMRQSEDQIRTLRHDMKNHLSILRQYADEGRKPELEQYLDAFSSKLERPGYVHTGNSDVDSILNYKLEQAVRAGAKPELDIVLPGDLAVDAFDLNVLLGNLLDNAIEALAGSKDKRLALTLRVDRGVFYLKLVNSFDGVVLKTEDENGLIYRSRKSESGHGLGLEIVRRTVEQYHGQLELHSEHNIFTAEALLYLQE